MNKALFIFIATHSDGGEFHIARAVNGNWGLLPESKNQMNARCAINN